MFRDRSEELQRLEEALLEEEVLTPAEEPAQDEDLLNEDMLDELLEDTAPAKDTVVYQNFSNDYGQTGPLPEYEEDLDEEPAPRQKKDQFGIVIIACLVLTGVLCAIAFLLLRQGGIL